VEFRDQVVLAKVRKTSRIEAATGGFEFLPAEPFVEKTQILLGTGHLLPARQA